MCWNISSPNILLKQSRAVALLSNGSVGPTFSLNGGGENGLIGTFESGAAYMKNQMEAEKVGMKIVLLF